jgi:hypothetical protein
LFVLKQSCNRHAFVSDAGRAAELQRSPALIQSYMKYFTLQKWIDGQNIDNINTDEIFRPLKNYESYLESVRNKLPVQFLPLLEKYTIHDSALRQLVIDPLARTAVMQLDCDDIDTHDLVKLTLTYKGLSSYESVADPEKGLPGPHGYGDLGMDEIEVLPDSTYEHRIVFSSGIEVSFRFSDFSLQVNKPE